MAVDTDVVTRMLKRFEGFGQAYGSYDPTAAMRDFRGGGKVEIKATAYTKRKPVTNVLWRDHLNGKTPLGIIPIRDNNTCLWGVIDIDEYNIKAIDVLRRCEEEGYPFIACASKSDGIHLFLFMAQPVEAKLFQMRLREMAATLGYGGSEVFPKQSKVELDRGDLGSWLNMPYFGDARWAYRPDGTKMPIKEFLDLADKLEQPANWLESEAVAGKKYKKTSRPLDMLDFRDGPPCMQHIASIGLSEGGRNNGMYAFGIYAKKKFPHEWKEVLERWNRDIAMPPLPITELVDIIKRLEQKDYFYPCKDQPIVSHCNAGLCRTRKFGVASGSDKEFPEIGGLTVIPTEDPLWFLDVNGRRVELNTDQLLSFKAFHKLCAQKLFIYLQPITQKAWGEIIGPAMAEVNMLEYTPEMGYAGKFVDLLDEFLTNQYTAKNRHEMTNGRPWFDDQETVTAINMPKGPKHFFRLKDLEKFLEDAGFKVYSTLQITTRLKSLGGRPHFFKLQSNYDKKDTEEKAIWKGVNVWWVPVDFAPGQTVIPTIEVEEEPI